MTTNYQKNHYVPVWYQKGFLPEDSRRSEIFYLDLKPGGHQDSRGIFHRYSGLHRWGPRRCFWEQNLYSTQLGAWESTDIERFFFGQVDNRGKTAVDFFSGYEHLSVDHQALNDLMLFMTTQKLRTPKGLQWLNHQVRATNKDVVMQALMQLRTLFSAIWMEAVWQLADASNSTTKFIISDHPVTVYNRSCLPSSKWCRGVNDPDIRLQGSHTLFPLSAEKILILTNLSWVRNPYQSAVGMRPNPAYFRGSVFRYQQIQTHRDLSELEVQQMNFIIKSRALRYVGASDEAWLHPEEFI